jgi:hypothetical protein
MTKWPIRDKFNYLTLVTVTKPRATILKTGVLLPPHHGTSFNLAFATTIGRVSDRSETE